MAIVRWGQTLMKFQISIGCGKKSIGCSTCLDPARSHL